MSVSQAYHILFTAGLVWFAILIAVMLIKAIIGPGVTDRILAINMIGTMVICCILILSVLLDENYLTDVALIYAMISYIAVLILATVYIPANPKRKRFGEDVKREVEEGRRYVKEQRAEIRRKMEEEGFTLVLRENDDWLYFEDLTIVPVSSSPDWDLDDDEEE